jgi:hypothetical protein
MVNLAESDSRIMTSEKFKLRPISSTISTEGNGNMSVAGSHTAFPSLEVFAYQDGKEPQQVYVYNAPADNFVDGVVDINRTVKVAPPQ